VSEQKTIGYATENLGLQDVVSFSELQPPPLQEIEHFFSIYKDLAKETRLSVGKLGKRHCR
jgi:hypothetical protein